MALFAGSLYAESLGMNTGVTVSLPGERRDRTGDMPVLYLLHGLSDDHTSWVRRTDIDRYAEEWGVAVIMPEVQRSFYCDMTNGPRYFTYIVDELPALCQRLFRVSARREDNFVAGLSMGGYGALRLALRYPGRYAAAASLSGCVEMEKGYETFASRGPFMLRELDDVYGSEHDLLRGPGSLFGLADRFLKEPDRAPRMYMACGTEDFLFGLHKKFVPALEKNGWDVTHEETPGFGHEWAYWDAQLAAFLPFALGD